MEKQKVNSTQNLLMQNAGKALDWGTPSAPTLSISWVRTGSGADVIARAFTSNKDTVMGKRTVTCKTVTLRSSVCPTHTSKYIANYLLNTRSRGLFNQKSAEI